MKKSKFYALLTILLIASSLIMGVAAPPSRPVGPPPSADLDQLRNGKASTPLDPGVWHNGDLNPQQSHYIEGYSIPYRIVMEHLETGTPVTITIGFDIKKNGKHAIDYLTVYDYIDDPSHNTVYGHDPEDIDPLDGVTGVSATITTWAIPAPSSTGSEVPGQPTASFNSIPAADRVITLFGGSLSSVVYADQGDLTEDTDEAQVSITFTPDSTTAVLAWGGHIASAEDWGYDGDKPRSASGISGAPYHTSLVEWNLNTLGKQDRSLQLEPPCTIIVQKVIDWGYYTQYIQGWDFTFDPSWTDEFTLGHMDSKSFKVLPGTHSVTETNLGVWTLYKVTIEGGGYDDEVSGPTAEVEIEAGDVITITFINRPPDFVIPENPLGILGSIIVMLGVIAQVTVFRKGGISLVIK